ncbi:NF-Y protein [Artemisia annua]|uniref:NF-Y protein n=1 Tax=Artemisia annua TaxID=35608 RepID=A0A2U1LJ62_ARTAN|nr:NF-Y protein [Artemisia annua]
MATSPKATPTVTEKVIGEAEELPKAVVRRVVKEKLSQLSQDGADIQVLKDSLSAFSESSRIFIHYLSATANDICKESKRQTINAEDVFKALEEIEFPEFIASLRTSLEAFSAFFDKRNEVRECLFFRDKISYHFYHHFLIRGGQKCFMWKRNNVLEEKVLAIRSKNHQYQLGDRRYGGGCNIRVAGGQVLRRCLKK